MRPRIRLCVAVGLASASAAGGADWPQFNLDARHSGASYQEARINLSNVGSLHLRYAPVALPSVADGSPIFLEGVSTSDGPKDLVFVTTKDGTVIAIDVDTGDIRWSRQPATGPRYTTSSPAADPDRQFVYSYGLDGYVHKYRAGDGTESTGGGWPQLATLKPDVEKGSSALTIAVASGTPYLYVTNGGYPGDAGDYQGHVTAIDLSTGTQRVFNANCSDRTCHLTENGSGDCSRPQPDCPAVQTAIWARAGVVFVAELGQLFMATGNGRYNAVSGGSDWGDSVFAINPDGTGNGSGWPLDSYTPTEYQSLQDADADLGSTAPAILNVPAGSVVPHVAVQSGKDGMVRLLNLGDLSGRGGPGHVGGELQRFDLPQGGEVLTAPAVWVDPATGATWAYVANGRGLSGFRLGLGSGGVPRLSTVVPEAWTIATGGSSPIIANGVLFYASHAGIRAINPKTSELLWRDDTLGSIHWESPIVVNGRVYVTDETAHLLVYETGPEEHVIRRHLRRPVP
ncbi:MAG: PQQ-binding-like beta-propeller repeat protein [Acidobacteriia bacterium]|nr:PQQ-binding-like beta-propeller repeat protein [Terriglobia bacterium]